MQESFDLPQRHSSTSPLSSTKNMAAWPKGKSGHEPDVDLVTQAGVQLVGAVRMEAGQRTLRFGFCTNLGSGCCAFPLERIGKPTGSLDPGEASVATFRINHQTGSGQAMGGGAGIATGGRYE
jgi:hypothetical protein